MKLGQMQALIGVDVTDAGDRRLIEDGWLDRTAFVAGQLLAKAVEGEVGRKRLRPEAGHQGILLDLVGRNEFNPTKLSKVIEEEPITRLEAKDDLSRAIWQAALHALGRMTAGKTLAVSFNQDI